MHHTAPTRSAPNPRLTTRPNCPRAHRAKRHPGRPPSAHGHRQARPGRSNRTPIAPPPAANRGHAIGQKREPGHPRPPARHSSETRRKRAPNTRPATPGARSSPARATAGHPPGFCPTHARTAGAPGKVIRPNRAKALRPGNTCPNRANADGCPEAVRPNARKSRLPQGARSSETRKGRRLPRGGSPEKRRSRPPGKNKIVRDARGSRRRHPRAIGPGRVAALGRPRMAIRPNCAKCAGRSGGAHPNRAGAAASQGRAIRPNRAKAVRPPSRPDAPAPEPRLFRSTPPCPTDAADG